MNAQKNKNTGDAPAAAEQQATTATENPESGGNAQQLPETTAAPAPEQEAELIEEADASDEAAADAAGAADQPAEAAAPAKAPIDGPVALLGKTQEDAAAIAHAAGTVAETIKTAEPAAAAPSGFDVQWPPGFDAAASGYRPGQIIDAAIAAHEANKAYCESIGDASQVDWMLAPRWQQDSAINGVCYAIANNFPSPEEMHINWMKEKVAAGWHWGVVKDAEAKTHPCIMPYANLPEEQRIKDDIFRGTIKRVLGPRAAPVKAAEPADDEDRDPTQEEMGMLSMFQCALAMVGLYNDPMSSFGDDELGIAFCLAKYFENEPTAPAAGGLMQVRLQKKVVLLPNEDPRRVELALDLFRLALVRMLEFANADAKAEAERQLAATAPKPAKIPEGEGTFEHDDDRFTKSDIGKALDKRAL
jgi:RyR domain